MTLAPAGRLKIGLTYDLRDDYIAAGFDEEATAEFDRADTIEFLERAIRSRGYQTERIGRLDRLIDAYRSGRRWDLVFNIAEGLHGFGRESVIPALLESWGIPCTFSDPLVLAVSLHKGVAKRIVRDQGIATPDFAVCATPREVAQVSLPFPLFIKPVAEGTSKGVDASSVIRDQASLLAVGRKLIDRFGQPVLVETFLPGREFTVCLLGDGDETEVIGALEVHLLDGADANVYTYRNKEDCEELVRYSAASDAPAQAAMTLARRAWIALGARDAGRVDVRLDPAGKANFIECNPLPGLHPHHSDLPILCGLVGYPYEKLVGRIVESALARVGIAPTES